MWGQNGKGVGVVGMGSNIWEIGSGGKDCLLKFLVSAIPRTLPVIEMVIFIIYMCCLFISDVIGPGLKYAVCVKVMLCHNI